MRRYDRRVLIWLICFFPYGLLMMWSGNCRFSRLAKSAVSLVFVVAAVTLSMPQFAPPKRLASGVEVVGRQGAAEMFGPDPTEGFEPFEGYAPYYEPPQIVAEPTPAPTPVYVYCNDMGQYYHTKQCRYVKATTPRVTLTQALNAGFKRCDDCKPPIE